MILRPLRAETKVPLEETTAAISGEIFTVFQPTRDPSPEITPLESWRNSPSRILSAIVATLAIVVAGLELWWFGSILM